MFSSASLDDAAIGENDPSLRTSRKRTGNQLSWTKPGLERL